MPVLQMQTYDHQATLLLEKELAHRLVILKLVNPTIYVRNELQGFVSFVYYVRKGGSTGHLPQGQLDSNTASSIIINISNLKINYNFNDKNILISL